MPDNNSLLDSLDWGGEEPTKPKLVTTRLPGQIVARMVALAEKNGLSEHALRVVLFEAAVGLAEQGIIQITTTETTETKVTHAAEINLPDERK